MWIILPLRYQVSLNMILWLQQRLQLPSEKSGIVIVAYNFINYFCLINGYWIYVDILTGKTCCQFRLLTWTSFIGQFVHLRGGEGMDMRVGIVISASCEFHFIRVHENLVQQSSNNIWNNVYNYFYFKIVNYTIATKISMIVNWEWNILE